MVYSEMFVRFILHNLNKLVQFLLQDLRIDYKILDTIF